MRCVDSTYASSRATSTCRNMIHLMSEALHLIGRIRWLTAVLYVNRFKIQDDHDFGKDELAAWACIRLDRLRTGYRFVHLLDANGLESKGVLLVHISKTLS